MSVYIIRCKDKSITDCYIGSTNDIEDRKITHKKTCYNINTRGYNYKVYQFIRDNGGWDNFELIEICKYEDDKRKEMEQYYIDFIKPSLNDKRAFGFDYERRNAYKKINDREYYLKNKTKCNEYRQSYKNAKVICDCGKEVSRHALYWARKTGTHNHKPVNITK